MPGSTRLRVGAAVTALAVVSLLVHVTGRAVAQPGVPDNVTLVLDPPSIKAGGTPRAESTATATVTDSLGDPVPLTGVTFTTSGDVTFTDATVMTGVNGEAKTTIIASATVGPETITATTTVGDVEGTATLTEYGDPAAIALNLNPAAIRRRGAGHA